MRSSARSVIPAVLALLACLSVSSLGEAAAQPARPPTIAAAASFRFVLEEIAAAFGARTGRQVRFSFGATGNLVRQIEEGAPFELFLAADEASVLRLEAAGLAEKDGQILVRGRLCLLVPKGGTVTADAALDGLRKALADGSVSRFAIAKPELAPYGRAAREVLERHGLWAAMESRLVMGENIAQAGQYVASGAAQAGMVAWSIALSAEVARVTQAVLLPEDWHGPIRQRGAALRHAGPAAREFLAFLRSAEAKAVFVRSGFAVD